jgi:hypothetical protein
VDKIQSFWVKPGGKYTDQQYLLNQFPVINPLKNKMNLRDAYVTIWIVPRREHSVLPLERVVCEYVQRGIKVSFIMQNTLNT